MWPQEKVSPNTTLINVPFAEISWCPFSPRDLRHHAAYAAALVRVTRFAQLAGASDGSRDVVKTPPPPPAPPDPTTYVLRGTTTRDWHWLVSLLDVSEGSCGRVTLAWYNTRGTLQTRVPLHVFGVWSAPSKSALSVISQSGGSRLSTASG